MSDHLPLDSPIAVNVMHNVHIHIYLDVDEWVVRDNGRDASVTYLSVVIGQDGKAWLNYPKGVRRRANGVWSAAERNLFDVLPRLDGRKAWAAVPPHVKAAIQTAYAQRVAQMPAALPIP